MNRMRAIFWLVSLVAVFAASVPAVAQAHAGHGYYGPGHHVSGHAHHAHAQPATFDAGLRTATDPLTDVDCSERGCCFVSHCVSCTAFIAPDANAVWPRASNFVYGRMMTSALASGPSDRLRRPPKPRS